MKKILDTALVNSWYKPRQPESHKGTYGHGLLLAGSKGMIGAAVISSRACLRTGIGLLSTLVPASERFILQQAIPEAMLAFELPNAKRLKKFSAIGVGPGIGTNKAKKKQIEKILEVQPKNLLLDADALNILASHNELLQSLPSGTILTPHIKEFDRIFGTHPNVEQRIEAAAAVAKQLQIIIVLKNATTVITNGDHLIYNDQPNAGLAKASSGDMLTGIILALLSQGYEPMQAASMGVFIHSQAGKLCLQSQSMESMLATDVVEYIGMLFKTLEQ